MTTLNELILAKFKVPHVKKDFILLVVDIPIPYITRFTPFKKTIFFNRDKLEILNYRGGILRWTGFSPTGLVASTLFPSLPPP